MMIASMDIQEGGCIRAELEASDFALPTIKIVMREGVGLGLHVARIREHNTPTLYYEMAERFGLSIPAPDEAEPEKVPA